MIFAFGRSRSQQLDGVEEETEGQAATQAAEIQADEAVEARVSILSPPAQVSSVSSELVAGDTFAWLEPTSVCRPTLRLQKLQRKVADFVHFCPGLRDTLGQGSH